MQSWQRALIVRRSAILSSRPPLTVSSDLLAPNQFARLSLGISEWHDRCDPQESVAFVTKQLKDVLHGSTAAPLDPPPIDLACSHITKVSTVPFGF
jgi:hypothetical protein